MVSKNLAIMFTDMKGYTSQTSKNSRSQVEKLIDLQEKIILPVIKRFGGNLIKTIGDSYMVTFESPTSAVLCGIKIQEAVKDNLELRIAINTGDVNVKKGDVFGEPVNLAARLETIAEPGEVFITEAVYLAMNKNEIKVSTIGPRRFKGIPYEVKVYRILHRGSPFELLKDIFLRNTKPALGIGLVVLFILGFSFWKVALGKQTNTLGSSSVEGLSTTVPTFSPTPTPSPTPVPTPEPTPRTIYIVITPSPDPTKTPTPKRYKHWPNN